MSKSALAVVSIVLCSVLLAACGDSGSSSSSSATATATVPSGKLGATAPQACTPPRISGATVTALTATNVPCGTASNALSSVFRTNRFPDWTCRQTISGRNVRFVCTNDGDTTQTITGGWVVA